LPKESNLAFTRTNYPAVIILLAALIAGWVSLSAQTGNPEAIAEGYTIPIGEKLMYSIDWDPPWYLFFFPHMQAGNAELFIEGKDKFKGRDVLRIRFKIYSSGLLSRLSGMEISDDFIFLSDPETLCTLKVSKKIREGKRKRQLDVEYLPATRQLHITEYDESVEPPTLKRDIVKDDIPACVRDPFSALYYLRSFPLDDDSEMTSAIGNDDVVKEVRTRVEKLEALDTTAGKIPAWRIQTEALMGALFKKGGEFKIWLTADDRQVPLQFEAKVPLGRVMGKLQESREPDNPDASAPAPR
jgi:hypothetical protein